ncbi:MAG: hypothetical protein PHQ72_06635 [Hespellia sp.]|nr:hypothetical protein [Hespellia sp.]
MIIVYLSNRYIRVIDGETSSGKIHVKRMLYTVDTSGCILNGTITDDEAFSEIISQLWETNHLETKNVKLVIDSSQFTMKVVDAPIFKPKQLLEFIGREFNDVERISDPVYGGFVLEETMQQQNPKAKKTKMQKVFATMAPRAFLQKYMDIFEENGIEIDGIGSALGAALRLTAISPHESQGTGSVQMADDTTLTNFLFVDGMYRYSSRTRLFSDAGTPEYAVEIARNVSNLLQFAKAQELAQEIPRVVIAGLDQDTCQIYKDSVEQIDNTMEVNELELENFVQVDQPPAGNQEVMNFIMAVGGLIKTDKKLNMITQLNWNPEKAAAVKKRNRVLIPVLSMAGVLLLAAVILLGRVIYYSVELRSLDSYNNRADIVERVEEYDIISQQIQVMGTLAGSMSSLQSGLLAYPKVDRVTENAVAASASGLVTAQIEEYDAVTGIVSLEVTADNVDRIHQFIMKLSQQSMFAYVDYTGYSQDSDGRWKVQVNCTMAEREVEQDDAETD